MWLLLQSADHKLLHRVSRQACLLVLKVTRRPDAGTGIRAGDGQQLMAHPGVAVENADEEGSQLLVHAELLSYHLTERRASPLVVNLGPSQTQSTTLDPRST